MILIITIEWNVYNNNISLKNIVMLLGYLEITPRELTAIRS